MSRIIPAGRRRPAAAPLPQRRISFSLRMKRILRAWQLYVLLAPAIIYILVFKYWPMYGVQIAFKNYNPVDGFTDSPWVGLTHFIRFVNSYQFGQVIGNTLWIARTGSAGGLPGPHHPGVAGQPAPKREVQEVHPDGALLAGVHLHRCGGGHHVRGPVPAVRAGEQRDPTGRRASRSSLWGRRNGSVPSTSSRMSGKTPGSP